MNKQKFIDKFLRALVVLAIIKIIAIFAEFFQKTFWSVIGNLVIFTVVLVIIFFVVIALQNKERSGNSSEKKGGGGNFYLENSLFDRIRNKYEELAEKYIAEKDYTRAAKVYMNLLNDNYRGAKTLEDGGLYNEAAVIYLKKLKNRSEAASCFEKAKQYQRSIELYKELEQKEKVGDLYIQINDAKNANSYYQMVVDDYVNNDQMVKASLIYRKKMDFPEEAQKILLQGWEENKDAFNCLNNYFVNINTIEDLNHTIQNLYLKTPSDKKLIYLEAMKHEFKKDSKLQETTRNIAYEIIAENIENHSSIINELKHFNPKDEVILKDISRYRTGRNKMFRN
ncbi:lipopolysaccharide assembly protein LapB [Chryseobacterium sp. NKUCC03_KSP]|uniref:tetratricopeptide repeat protein n=1 Tax=Chryseobacterium sp. NKUCC03_KSP TaxID=2842125 RepID=UPI001C5B0697|nr:soluble NSF attachment family protein [Chryseobacterium sp. NKUCC03_KSP]MBW3524765.1 soluble NSF attachment family protein [Chryseobacterium sp. NKUCC03_KSP]